MVNQIKREDIDPEKHIVVETKHYYSLVESRAALLLICKKINALAGEGEDFLLPVSWREELKKAIDQAEARP